MSDEQQHDPNGDDARRIVFTFDCIHGFEGAVTICQQAARGVLVGFDQAGRIPSIETPLRSPVLANTRDGREFIADLVAGAAPDGSSVHITITQRRRRPGDPDLAFVLHPPAGGLNS